MIKVQHILLRVDNKQIEHQQSVISVVANFCNAGVYFHLKPMIFKSESILLLLLLQWVSFEINRVEIQKTKIIIHSTPD